MVDPVVFDVISGDFACISTLSVRATVLCANHDPIPDNGLRQGQMQESRQNHNICDTKIKKGETIG